MRVSLGVDWKCHRKQYLCTVPPPFPIRPTDSLPCEDRSPCRMPLPPASHQLEMLKRPCHLCEGTAALPYSSFASVFSLLLHSAVHTNRTRQPPCASEHRSLRRPISSSRALPDHRDENRRPRYLASRQGTGRWKPSRLAHAVIGPAAPSPHLQCGRLQPRVLGEGEQRRRSGTNTTFIRLPFPSLLSSLFSRTKELV